MSKSTGRRVDWRSVLFRVVAILIALLYLVMFEGLSAAFEAWAPTGEGSDPHRWHNVVYGLFSGLLLGGTLLAVVPRPRRSPALMQLYVVLGLLLAGIELAAQGAPLELLVTTAVLVGLPTAAYPEPRSLLRFRGTRTGLWPLAGVTLLVVLPEIIWNLRQHVAGSGGSHLEEGHWLGAAGLAVAIAIAATIVAAGAPGWRGVAAILALVLLVGGASAMTLPSQPGSWGAAGGAAALALAAGWAALPWRAFARSSAGLASTPTAA